MKECDCCHLLNPDEAIECEHCEAVIPTTTTPLQAAIDHWEKRLKEVESHPLSLHWSNTITAKDLRLFVDAAKQLEAFRAENAGLKTKCALQHQLLRSVFYAAEFYPNDNGYRLKKVLSCTDNGKEVLQELDLRDSLKLALESANQIIGAQANENDKINGELNRQLESTRNENTKMRVALEFAELHKWDTDKHPFTKKIKDALNENSNS